MSSVVTIGFLDRTRACVRIEFTPPLADDERRETLIHVAFLTARTFAAIPPERQPVFAGVLRNWIDTRFASCPVQLEAGDPMVSTPRFASSFLAPSREYALATSGCSAGADGIEYFLPMATALFLRRLVEADRDPAELLKPASALCAAVVIHPITLATHFQIAVASLPKIEPVVDRTSIVEQDASLTRPHASPSQHVRETRRSLIASAFIALLLIVAGVQYLSTRVPEAGDSPPPGTLPPRSVSTPPPPVHVPEPTAVIAPAPAALPPVGEAPAMRPPSMKEQMYRRAIRDIAENSLAQVDVMFAAIQRKDLPDADLSETLDYGMRQIEARHRRFTSLKPPSVYEDRHHEIGQILADLTGLARNIYAIDLRSAQTAFGVRLTAERLTEMHVLLEGVMDSAEGF